MPVRAPTGDMPPPATVGDHGVEISPYGHTTTASSEQLSELVAAQGSAREFDDFAAQALRDKAKASRKREEQRQKEEEKTRKQQAKADAQRAKEEEEARRRHLPAEEIHSESPVSREVSSPSTSLPDGHLSPLSPTPSNASPASRSSKHTAPRHFIVLPWTMGYRWQSVAIEGVDDEVAAHTGMFFRNQNFEYDALVEKAGTFVITWCE